MVLELLEQEQLEDCGVDVERLLDDSESDQENPNEDDAEEGAE